MLDSSQSQQQTTDAAVTPKRPVVSYAKDHQLTGKYALPLAAVGFGYAIVARKSKILYVLIGATLGFAVEGVVKSTQR